MTITTTDLTNWLGPTWYASNGTSGPLTATQVQAALDAAVRYCQGYLAARGAGASGQAYDSAVEAVAHGHLCLMLDSMGLKPSSFTTEGGGMSSESLGTTQYWFKLGDQRLADAYLAGQGNRRELYLRHVRGNRGMF